MKPSTIFVLVAAFLVFPLDAQAQHGDRHRAMRALHHVDVNDRARAEQGEVDTDYSGGRTGAPEVSSPAGRPLPNWFRNCEEPAPRWCTHNY
jgi:hypothetical protein